MRKSGQNKTAIQPTPQPIATPAPSFDEATFISVSRKIHCRPLGEQPVHKDISRLINNLIITDGQKVLFEWFEKEKKEGMAIDRFHAVGDFMVLLAQIFDNPAEADWIKELYFKEYVQRKEFGEGMKEFFQQLQSQNFPCNFVSILKCIHQNMIYGGVIAFRACIGDTFRYVDCRGTWRISITITDSFVEVRHLKSEKSPPETIPDETFQFDWEFLLRFTRDLSSFTPSLFITNYILSPTMPKTLKQELKSRMAPFFSPTLPYSMIWEKDLKTAALVRALPRFINKTIVESNGSQLWVSDVNLAQDVNIRSLLLTLAQIFDEYAKVEKILSGEQSVLKFFNGENPLLQDTRTLAVVKLMSSDTPYPCIMTMKDKIGSVLPYSDQPKSWSVKIQIQPQSGQALVIHTKSERSAQENQFTFQWCLQVLLSRDFSKIEDISFFITKYEILNLGASDQIKSCLGPFLLPPAHAQPPARPSVSPDHRNKALSPDSSKG